MSVNALLPAALPALGWNIEVSVERRADRTLVRARGSHGRFPNYELYVNGVPLLHYSTLGETTFLPLRAEMPGGRSRRCSLADSDDRAIPEEGAVIGV